MNKSTIEQIRNIELFMLSQFIDVLNVLDKIETIKDLKEDIKRRKKVYLQYINDMADSKNFLSLSLYDSDIDAKIKRCREIYCESIKYKITKKRYEREYKKLFKALKTKDIKKLDKIKKIIYELFSFDVHLSYKIGLIDGIQIKGN